MAKCKFNRKLRCGESTCDEQCPTFKASKQQTLAPPPLRIIKKKASKGHTTIYYGIPRPIKVKEQPQKPDGWDG